MTTLAAALAFVSLALCGTSPHLPAAAAPQDPLSGLLLGSPLGFTTRGNENIQIKLAGFEASLPSLVTRPAFERLVSDILATLPVPKTGEPPILAMSLGMDVIVPSLKQLIPGTHKLDGDAIAAPIDIAILEVGIHGWYAIEFSVNSAQLDPQDVLAPDIEKALTDGELDRSVFSYVLPDSHPWVTLLPGEEHSVRCLSPTTLDLSDTKDEIHALNLHMGLYDTDLGKYPNVFTTRPLPPNPSVYFTLRPEFATPWVTEVVKTTWGGTGDSSTIYKTNWVGNRWTQPGVYRTAQSFGIEGKDPPIIDGLAIDTRLTQQTEDDFVLFSLASTSGRLVPAEAQMLFKGLGEPGPPRRTVVKINGDYHSLGKVMKGGRGIGDFCSGDPFARREGKASDLAVEFFPDDFLIARRLPNDEDKSGELALSIAAYRQEHLQPFVRACLSWPGGKAKSADVIVRFGLIPDITATPLQYQWNPSALQLQYSGKPLTFDWPLPADGVLLPPPGPPQQKTCAFIIKWQLKDKGKAYISPVAALRY